jgi:hypothetical protein
MMKASSSMPTAGAARTLSEGRGWSGLVGRLSSLAIPRGHLLFTLRKLWPPLIFR